MPKLKRLRKRQKFGYNRNRRRMKMAQERTKNPNIKVASDVMREHWDGRKAIKRNLSHMGLAFDPNKAINSVTPASLKQELVDRAKGEIPGAGNEDVEDCPDSVVVRKLKDECQAVEKRQTFRFPKDEVRWMTAMMEKHGDNFKAMARDPKNIYQLTPKQIRGKIVKFISIPEQFAEAARDAGILDQTKKAISRDNDADCGEGD